MSKLLNKTVAYLDPSVQARCRAYLTAKAQALKADRTAREMIYAAKLAQYKAWGICNQASQEVDPTRQRDKRKLAYPARTIVLSLRNGRWYEALPQHKDGYDQGYLHLSSKTGRTIANRYVYGPKVVIPDTHPFVKKRANARLAERLEGKDV